MNNLSQAQIAQIFGDFWKQAFTPCPNCSNRIDLPRNDTGVSHRYNISGECQSCQFQIKLWNGQDPLKSIFQDWTEQQTTQMVNEHNLTRVCHCPNDGTIAEVDQTVAGKLTIHCPRCLRDWQQP